MSPSVKQPLVKYGPYALIVVAGVAQVDYSVVNAIGTLAPDVVTMGMAAVWPRCYRSLFGDEGLLQDPLRQAMERALANTLQQLENEWRRQSKRAQPAGTSTRKGTAAVFNRLRSEIDRALEVGALGTLTGESELLAELDRGPRRAQDMLEAFLEQAIGESIEAEAHLLSFLKGRLAPTLAKTFNAEIYGSNEASTAAWKAFQRLAIATQNAMLESILASQAKTELLLAELQQSLEMERARPADERETAVAELVNQIVLEGTRRLEEANNAAQFSRVKIVPVAKLRMGIGPLSNINIPVWNPDAEQELPHDREAAQIFARNRVLVIKGKASSGKTHLAAKLILTNPDARVVFPVPDVTPPSFEALRGEQVILFIDDFHDWADRFDPRPWWTSLADACGEQSVSLLITSRSGDYWRRVMDSQRSFIGQLRDSVFDIPDLREETRAELAEGLRLDDQAHDRFDGTIGSLVLARSGMDDAYRRLYDQFACLDVRASRLLDAAKLLRKVRQSPLKEDALRCVSARVLGGGRDIVPECWRALKELTKDQGFGRFEDDIYVTYIPFLEGEDIVTYSPDHSDLSEVARVLLELGELRSLINLGWSAILDLHRPDLAKAAWRAGMDAGSGEAAFNLGEMLYRDGEEEEARKVWQRGIDLGHKEATFIFSVALNGEQAKAAWEIGMELGYGGAAFNLGVAHDNEGNIDGAKTAWRRGADLGHGGAAFKLGVALNNQGDLDGARQAWQRGMELGNGEAANRLGELFNTEGDFEEAKAAWWRGVELGDGRAAGNLGTMLKNEGDVEGAKREWRKGIEFGSSDTAYKLGELLLNEGDVEEAGVAWWAAFELGMEPDSDWNQTGVKAAWRTGMESGNGRAANILGVVLRTEGDLAKAKEAWQTGMELGSGEAARNLGELLKGEGDMEEAKAAWRTGVELGDGEAARNLGELLKAEGDLAEAKVWWKHGMDLGDGDAAYRLGELLLDEGDEESAGDAWLAAFNLDVTFISESNLSGIRAARRSAMKQGDEHVADQLDVLISRLEKLDHAEAD